MADEEMIENETGIGKEIGKEIVRATLQGNKEKLGGGIEKEGNKKKLGRDQEKQGKKPLKYKKHID